MDHDDLRQCIDRALGRIAPDLDPATLPTDRDLVESADLDSMDFLNLVIGLHQELHVDIPERDYAQLMTLTGCIDYLQKATKD